MDFSQLTIIFVFLCIFGSKAQHYSESPYEGNVEGAIGKKSIVVDKHGHGDFTSVQKAIDSIPSNNKLWTLIHLNPAVYVEKVLVPQDKPCIVLHGDDSRTTVIQWGDAGSSIDSATLEVNADNFVAINITFKNTYNHALFIDRVLWAPAATIYADKVSFYGCGFVGVQDTLTDAAGRHYYKSCYIEGAIDFIWGDGQSFYEGCTLHANTAILNGTAGFVTAQGRDSLNDTSGFVFLWGSLSGTGPVNLGRAYRQYSRVLFKGMYMSNIVVPEGWSQWNQKGLEDLVTFSEVNCTGAGADKSKRVGWEKELATKDWDWYTNVNTFINQDGWIDKQARIAFT